IVVPEPLHEKIVRCQPAISLLVVVRVRVLAAIDFDDDASTEANEIADEWAERDLPSEFEASEAPITQSEPKLALGIGHLRTQRACTLACDRLSHRARALLRTLSPCGRGCRAPKARGGCVARVVGALALGLA